jgi:hypothetical protein
MSSTPSRGGWLASLGKGGTWLAGVIIVALVGALVAKLVPPLFGPDEIAAELSNVSVDIGVTLEEYSIRHADRYAAAQGGSATMQFVSAQAPVEPAAGADGETTTVPGQTTTVPGRTTTTPGQTTTTPGQTTTIPGQAILGPRLDAAERDRLGAGVQAALDEPSVPKIKLAPDCLRNAVDPSCGLASLQLHIEVADKDGSVDHVSQQTVERRLAEVFKGTRTEASASDPGTRELVGATVNFNVALTGFRGAVADVRWSLYSARPGGHVPGDWLRNQRVLLLRGEADKDRAGGEFWVPLPEVEGPFFIRVGVYDEDGVRLDYANTRDFR